MLDLVLGFGRCSKLVHHKQGQVVVGGSAAAAGASGISAPSMLILESPLRNFASYDSVGQQELR
jgi:hypothetical protein